MLVCCCVSVLGVAGLQFDVGGLVMVVVEFSRV